MALQLSNRRVRLLVAALITSGGARAPAAVNLELNPLSQAVSLGDTFEVVLDAVSADGENQEFLSVQAVIVWDASRLEFVGLRSLCPPAPCAPDTYAWFSSGLPNDALGDGINLSLTDGDLVYVAFGPFVPEEPRPVATASGLHVVAFRFRAVGVGLASVEIVSARGRNTRTLVDSGGNVLGTIGPPASAAVIACFPPTVAGVGSRYLRIEPQGADDPIALRVSGDPVDPDTECVSGFVQLNGRLGDQPVMRTPADWGTVFVTGAEIIPDVRYSVRAECGRSDPGTLVSASDEATTWRWGDVNGDSVVDVQDVSIVLGAAQGVFPPRITMENVDQAPCAPDGVIDTQDVTRVTSAAGGAGYPCFTPCGPGPGPDVFDDFINCLSGPTVVAPTACVRFDVTGEGHIDMADFAGLQSDFGAR